MPQLNAPKCFSNLESTSINTYAVASDAKGFLPWYRWVSYHNNTAMQEWTNRQSNWKINNFRHCFCFEYISRPYSASIISWCFLKVMTKCGKNQKQGFVELYTQRLIEGNIVRQKLSRLKLYRLRPHRLRLWWLRPIG